MGHLLFCGCRQHSYSNLWDIQSLGRRVWWMVDYTDCRFLINCFSILYCILQDIRQTCQKPQPHFVFQNKHDIPFVDREDLIEEVLSGISEKIVAHRDYYTKNIRYGIRNGKTSFAQKLCWELQCIKDQKGSDSHNFSPKVASKIGNIYLVNYTDYGDAFGTHIKTDYTYIKGKLNLIVVTNFQNVQFPWNDHLKDPDVFFVLLNFNDTSEDALFFADDKIVCLLNSLKDLPAFSSLVSGKTQDEIEAMAVKLGSLTHNSIGAIVDLLTSNEFLLLLEMDAPFVDFYLALKRGNTFKPRSFIIYCRPLLLRTWLWGTKWNMKRRI